MAARSLRTVTGSIGLICTLMITGCAGETPGSSAATPTVAFVVASSRLSFSVEMQQGFQHGVDQVGGVQAEVTGPDIVDGARQVQLFQAAVKSAPGGVSLFTLTPDLFVDPLSAASERKVPMIAVDNPPPFGTGVSLFVGNDNTELGELLANTVIARLPLGARGTVVIGTSAPGVVVLDNRAEGIRTKFTELRPEIKVVGPFDTKQEVSANLAAWKTLVRANPRALAYLGTGDADGWNLAAIRSSTHATWLAAAFDLDPKALKAVKAGDLLLVSPEHFLKGDIAGHLQASHAKTLKKLPEGWIYTPGLAVTKDNIDAVIARQASVASKAAAFDPQVEEILSRLPGSLRSLDDVR